MVDLSDQQIGAGIVAACRSGDRDAFRVVYELYKDRVYSIALYFFHGDPAVASDVTQQVFLKLMTSMGQFRWEAGVFHLAVSAWWSMHHARTQPGGANPTM